MVIVAIDARSIDALGSWPWPRARHGQLIYKLTALGVNAIGMAVAIITPDKNHPENDQALAQAIRRNGRVVVPVSSAEGESGGSLQERMPIPEIASAAAALGQADVPVDDDGISRTAELYAGARTPYWPAWPLAVYELDHPRSYTPENAAPHGDSPAVWTGFDFVLLRYAGPAGTFPNVSSVDVLNGTVDPASLKGKTVLYGMTAPGIGDRFAVPVPSMMPGVEQAANVLESLRRDMLIAPLGFAGNFLFGMVALAFPLLIYGWPGFRRTWLVAVVSVAVFLTGSLTMLRLMNIWWPPVSAIAIVICGSIAWRLLASRMRQNPNAGE